MLRPRMLAAMMLAGTCLPATVAAEPARGAMGGGFIEMLMTGRDPSPATRQLAPAYGVQQPRVSPRQDGMRYAALPPYEPAGRIEMSFDSRFERQVVSYDGPHGPGTVIIDSPSKFLYLVQGNGTAMRYGIGVGRPGFTWSGVKTITRKAEWPNWTPPPEMLKRRPDLPRFMTGGEDNPLGARALYLGSTLYRIHGTNEPHTIGTNVSSGCIRLRNEDVIDLYQRVRVGTKVIVI
jgi:lipoprotein-anchoring transpeptidase ErfK/SrfK